MAATTRALTKAIEVRCHCGAPLTRVLAMPGSRVVFSVHRCRVCHKQRLPAYPVVFVQACESAVLYQVQLRANSVDIATLPWPMHGWLIG